MEFNFFTIWFFISPFIILHLYLKNREYKDKAGTVIEQINDVWDKDYKGIITTYGTVEHFLDCHRKDYDVIRSNIVKIYECISSINREYMFKTDRLLDMIENRQITKKEICHAIKMIKKSVCEATDDELTQINAFLVDEERAHTKNEKMIDVLNEIDERYKNNDIYKEVNK